MGPANLYQPAFLTAPLHQFLRPRSEVGDFEANLTAPAARGSITFLECAKECEYLHIHMRT